MKEKNIKKFQKLVWDFYKQNKRKLPWRETTNPYNIWVSEIMLQQTQVSRVIPKYKVFLKQFPNFKHLAFASTNEILKAWQGLGYYRRALNLKRTAEIVVKEYKGKLPQVTSELVKLPGIGPNTAGAILAYAFNEPVVFIETNIRKVFIHHFFKDQKSITDKQLLLLVEKGVDVKNPREWYWALMDYGSFLAASLENPNRKSKHYTKQSAFEGSTRKVRGQVIKTLLENSPQTYAALNKKIADARLSTVLENLKKDGLVTKKNNFWTIA